MPVGSKLLEMFDFMQAMLLAAGLGTRLRPYTFIRPKPLFPVLNRPLLLLLIDMAQQAGSRKIMVNGHHLSYLVQEAVSGIDNVTFQHEPEILGTGGSLRQALVHCDDEPLLVMNGDICHDVDISGLYNHHRVSGNAITMALHDHARFNTVRVHDEAVVTFHPGGKGSAGENLAFTGIQVVDPSIIERIPPGRFYHIIDLYEELIREGVKIGFVRVDGCLWYDIGTPEDYLELHGQLLTEPKFHRLPVARPEGLWMIDPDASIAENVSFSGWGCIGKAVIDSGASLRNCVVWNNAVIAAGSSFENMILTDGEW